LALGRIGAPQIEPSCPALCRASTPYSLNKKDVDGRAKPGHDANDGAVRSTYAENNQRTNGRLSATADNIE
jgi:hypothetical protein